MLENEEHLTTVPGHLSPRLQRAVLYGLAWLPPLGLLFYFLGQHGSFLQDLIDRDEFPRGVARSCWRFAQMNALSFYLPTVLIAVTILIVDEAAAVLLRRRQCDGLRPWWVGGVWAVGVFGWGMLLLCVLKVAALESAQ
jgi:hypothetical protein